MGQRLLAKVAQNHLRNLSRRIAGAHVFAVERLQQNGVVRAPFGFYSVVECEVRRTVGIVNKPHRLQDLFVHAGGGQLGTEGTVHEDQRRRYSSRTAVNLEMAVSGGQAVAFGFRRSGRQSIYQSSERRAVAVEDDRTRRQLSMVGQKADVIDAVDFAYGEVELAALKDLRSVVAAGVYGKDLSNAGVFTQDRAVDVIGDVQKRLDAGRISDKDIGRLMPPFSDSVVRAGEDLNNVFEDVAFCGSRKSDKGGASGEQPNKREVHIVRLALLGSFTNSEVASFGEDRGVFA